MSADFSNISILGGGLLGGSLALALSGTFPQVKLWTRREETARDAREKGIFSATTMMAEAVKDADLVVLAVPVGSMAQLVSDAIKSGLPATCLITDVGSVKRAPHREIPPLLVGHGMDFIGSHPMAGSEQNGFKAASPDLFRNAACLLTNDEEVALPRAEALERFWQAVGCTTSWLSSVAHDELVARISHLPHVVAAAAVHVCLKISGDGRFGGGGLRDTTRVAGGNPAMWTEILTENREALVNPLRETISELMEILAYLEAADSHATQAWLASAKKLRDTLGSVA